MTFSIRPALAADVATMQAIERDAGKRFADIGLQSIADADPDPPEVLFEAITEARAWIAVDADGTELGYLVASMVDGHGHVDQVSATIAAAGRGVGSALIDTAVEWTTSRGAESVTLTTFRDVTFNGPLYRRYGFTDIADSDLGPELVAIRAAEVEAGLDIVPRVAMIRRLAFDT